MSDDTDVKSVLAKKALVVPFFDALHELKNDFEVLRRKRYPVITGNVSTLEVKIYTPDDNWAKTPYIDYFGILVGIYVTCSGDGYCREIDASFIRDMEYLNAMSVTRTVNLYRLAASILKDLLTPHKPRNREDVLLIDNYMRKLDNILATQTFYHE